MRTDNHVDDQEKEKGVKESQNCASGQGSQSDSFHERSAPVSSIETCQTFQNNLNKDQEEATSAVASAMSTNNTMPKRSASAISRGRSDWSRMSRHVTVNDDDSKVFIPCSPITSAPSQSLEKQSAKGKSSVNEPPAELRRSVIYEPPQAEIIRSSKKRDNNNNAPVQLTTFRTRSQSANAMYENPTLRKDHRQPLPTSSPTADLDNNEEHYHHLWDLSSTNSIPAIPGKPTSSSKHRTGGEDHSNLAQSHDQKEYATMQSATQGPGTKSSKKPPKVLPKPIRQEKLHDGSKVLHTCQSSPQLPIVPAPPIPSRRDKDGSVTSDDVDEDTASLSSVESKEQIYANLDIKGLLPVDDKSINSHSDKIMKELIHGLELISSTQPDQTVTSRLAMSDSNSGGYIEPVHVEYSDAPTNTIGAVGPTSEDLSEEQQRIYTEPVEVRPSSPTSSMTSGRTYLSLMDDSTSMTTRKADSGIYVDWEKALYLEDSPLPGRHDELMLNMDDNSAPVNREAVPPLPRRPVPKKLPSLGQIVLRSVSEPSDVKNAIGKQSFEITAKQQLIAEVKKQGIKPSTELALGGLNAADIASLISKDTNFDDDLVALLPRVGQIDIRKIALCLKGMHLSV